MKQEIKYQPQYKGDQYPDHWHNAGYPVSKSEALFLVKNKLNEYLGPNPTRRLLRISEKVVEFHVMFKED